MTACKRIVILTYGTRGDVEPFVALGIRLRDAGHIARIVGPAPFASLVRDHELEFTPIEGDPEELAQSLTDQAGLNWMRMVIKVAQHVLPLAMTAISSIEHAVRDADLIIHSFLMTDAGHTLARMRGVPDISVQFFPVFLSTSAFPAVVFQDLPLGDFYRRATHALTNATFRYGSRVLFRIIRDSLPSFPDLAPWPFQSRDGKGTPILFAYSSNILPRPAEWPSYAQVIGYWQLPYQPGWKPEDALVRFLESGDQPIYFGPGSVQTRKLQYLLRILVEMSRKHGQRLILGVSPEVLAEDLKGADVFVTQRIPHAWLFPRMRYILHHGGAGTTGAAATAGVPNSAIPFTSDQAFWGRTIHHLGLGPLAPPARKLTRDRLDAVLDEALHNPAYNERAELLGEIIRKEDGITLALRIIHNRLGI